MYYARVAIWVKGQFCGALYTFWNIFSLLSSNEQFLHQSVWLLNKYVGFQWSTNIIDAHHIYTSRSSNVLKTIDHIPTALAVAAFTWGCNLDKNLVNVILHLLYYTQNPTLVFKIHALLTIFCTWRDRLWSILCSWSTAGSSHIHKKKKHQYCF